MLVHNMDIHNRHIPLMLQVQKVGFECDRDRCWGGRVSFAISVMMRALHENMKNLNSVCFDCISPYDIMFEIAKCY
jgi:hypothetical protein